MQLHQKGKMPNERCEAVVLRCSARIVLLKVSENSPVPEAVYVISCKLVIFIDKRKCFWFSSPDVISMNSAFVKKSFKNFRSSHRRRSLRKGILINFTKFTGKYLFQSLFFNKVAGLRPTTLLKRDSGTGVFL